MKAMTYLGSLEDLLYTLGDFLADTISRNKGDHVISLARQLLPLSPFSISSPTPWVDERLTSAPFFPLKVEVTVEDWKADAYLRAAGTYFISLRSSGSETRKLTWEERRADPRARVVGRVNIV